MPIKKEIKLIKTKSNQIKKMKRKRELEMKRRMMVLLI